MKYMQFNLSYVCKPNVLLKMMEGGYPNYFQKLPSKVIGWESGFTGFIKISFICMSSSFPKFNILMLGL